MAGIEKVCEFSGEYVGWDMYGYKREHIQILPKFRKNFAKAKHTLYLDSEKPYLQSRYGSLMRLDPKDMAHYEPPFETIKEYLDYRRSTFGERVVMGVEFTLEVEDPALAGQVKGRYKETTYDLKTLKRKLKRMLKCKTLNIVDRRHTSSTED